MLRDQRMCLCGVLAAEYQTLPEAMRQAVVKFFDDNETWLAAILEDGRQAGDLRFTGSAREAGRMMVSGLEGAMLVARLHGDPTQFEAAANRLLTGVAGIHDDPPPARRTRRTRPADDTSAVATSTTRRR